MEWRDEKLAKMEGKAVMIDFPMVGTKLEPVAESWPRLVSASFPPIPMPA